MVIDSEGIPYLFFDDFTDPSIKTWESTYNGSAWVVLKTTLAYACVGFPGSGFFGDYTQLVSGPDGAVMLPGMLGS